MTFAASRILYVATAAALLAACGGGGNSGAHAVPAAPPNRGPFGSLSFNDLPKGAPRPLAQMDSLAHVAHDTTPQLNFSPQQLLQLSKSLKFARGMKPAGNARTPRNVTTQSPWEHSAIGTQINTPFAGVYATQSGYQGFQIAPGTVNYSDTHDPLGFPSSNTVFADTTKEPAGCFESGSGYWTSLAAFYVYDFCRPVDAKHPGTFVVVKPFDGAWYQYANTYADGTQTYTIENFRTADGVDHAMLYNVRNSAWEELATEPAGASYGLYTHGWSFTEYYNEPNQGGGGGAAGPGYCQPIGFSGATDYLYRAVTATAYGLNSGSYSLENLSYVNSQFLDADDFGGNASCLYIQQGGVFPAYFFRYDNLSVNNVTSTWAVSAAGGFSQNIGSTWQQMAGGALDVATGSDGAIYVIGTDNAVYSWNGSSFVPYTGSGTHIAVDSNGNPWLVDAAGTISVHQQNGWQQVTGCALDVGANGGAVWVIGCDHGVYSWTGAITGNTFARALGSGNRIAVDGNGNPWFVDGNGSIFVEQAGTVRQVDGCARDVGANHGAVWVTGCAQGIYYWTGAFSGSTFMPVPGGATNIAVASNGLPVVTNASNQIFRRF
jgi:hypothetical protein